MPHATEASVDVKRCAALCQECHVACTELVNHCLEQGGPHAAAEHIGLLLDCAQICLASADFMHRNSPRHAQVCGVCWRVCEECAEDCERIGPGDADMKRCADVCRRCAASCRKMAA